MSYTLTDYHRAAAIARLLKRQGYEILMTPYRHAVPGHVIPTDDLIRRADKVVCICSPKAMRSKQVWQDMAMTRVWEKPVIPVLVKKFAYKTPIKRYIDATENSREAMLRLMSALKRSKKYTRNHLNDADHSREFPVTAMVRLSAAIAILSATVAITSALV